MATLSELLAQKATLAAIAQVKALMSQYGLSLADLGTRSAAASRRTGGAKVAAKYRNVATGESWSGRGLQPKWLKAALAAGGKLTDFAV
jgi:DNA-binding protein H-NS